jgi:two-component system, sensor histidine kinase and response regulator
VLVREIVLVVEDDLPMLEGIRDVLELGGYEVMPATNGREALAAMGDRAPDLILSDVMMPEMNGYELCQRVRENPEWASIPLVFLTAKGQRLDMRAGMEVGGDDYLVKPFEPEEILRAVRTRLRRVASITAESSGRLGRLRRGIIRVISHELRTPLTFVKGYTELLEESVGELSTNELTQFLHSIRTGSDRLNGLVNDLVLLVGLETGEAATVLEYERRRIDLAAVVAEAIDQTREQAIARKVVLQNRLGNEPLPISGHRTYLRDAVSRLLENACKFGRGEGGRIVVAGRSSQSWARIWISDNGQGIPVAELRHIFDPFYQVDREHQEQQGAGIGLPIARGIIELHGGTIDAESRVGTGSTFTLQLPLAERESSAIPSSLPGALASSLGD